MSTFFEKVKLQNTQETLAEKEKNSTEEMIVILVVDFYFLERVA